MVLKYDLRKDHKNESGEQGIIIKYNAKGEKSPWRLATRVYVKKEFFVNGVITDPNIPAAARNERQATVNSIMKRVTGIIKEFQEDGINEPSGKDVKAKYNDLYNKKAEEPQEEPVVVFEPKVTYTPVTAFEKFIADSKSGERRDKKGQIVGARQIINYQSTLNHLNNFSKEKKYNLDTWDKLDYKFYLAFTNFLFDDLNHFDGNCGKNVKHLKTFLNWAVSEKIIQNKLYDGKWVKWSENEVDSFVLYPDELKIIAGLTDHQLKAVINGTRTRDIFVVGCLTCLRVSDLMQVNDHINRVGNNFFFNKFDVKTQTSNGHKIHAVAADILRKYLDNDQTFPTMHDVTLNKDLKHLGEFLKRYFIKHRIRLEKEDLIIQDWEKAFRKGRKRRGKIVVYEKLDMDKCFTTHLMRRTGITSLLINRMPTIQVMKISNHKTVAEMQKYEKIASRFIDNSSEEVWNKLFLEKRS